MSTNSPDTLSQRLRAIEQLIAKRDLTAAAKKLNAAIKMAPEDPRIYLLGSRMAEAAGNTEGALEAAKRAVRAAPQWGRGMVELAQVYMRQGKHQEALEMAHKAVSLAPQEVLVVAMAVDVAHSAQAIPQAFEWLKTASTLAPESIDFKRLIARDLMLMDEMAKALAAYTDLLEDHPLDKESLLGRVQVAISMDNRTLAQNDSAKLLTIEPANELYTFWHQLAKGKTPSTLPDALIKNLYDGFANVFDQHLVLNLKYKLPRDVAQLILARYPDRKLNVLDLGCGTGLLGACLGRLNGALVGVDLSEPMVQQAARFNVYDKFHLVNLLDALAETPNALYQVITACDVFGYVGDLSTAIPDAHRILCAGGHLIFSCESTADEEADLVLRPGPRYAHKQSHIEALCRSAGFEDITLQTTVIRLERNEPVNGYLVIARKAV